MPMIKENAESSLRFEVEVDASETGLEQSFLNTMEAWKNFCSVSYLRKLWNRPITLRMQEVLEAIKAPLEEERYWLEGAKHQFLILTSPNPKTSSSLMGTVFHLVPVSINLQQCIGSLN